MAEEINNPQPQPAPAPVPQPAPQQPAPAVRPPLSEADKQDIAKNKLVAAIAYVSGLCILTLFLVKDSKFVKFHSKQGLVLFAVEIVGGLVFMRMGFLSSLFSLACLGFSAYAAYQAYEGKYWEIPVLGDLAKKINL